MPNVSLIVSMKLIYLFVFLLTTALCLPDHEFIADVKHKTSSDNTVTSKTTITLVEGAYKFSRTVVRKGVVYLNCRNKKKGCKASAIASLVGDPNNVKDYILEDISKTHTCVDSTVDRNKDKFKKKMKDKIKANPMSQPLPELYSDTRTEMCEALSPESKRQFLTSVGKFSDIATSLYSVQHSFVPPAPKNQLELDTLSS